MKNQGLLVAEAFTFDDVSLVPAYSEVLPSDVDVSIDMGRGITLKAPFFSAAMDTVTESDLAIAMAKAGGIGVIHKNMGPAEQAAHVGQTKAANALCAAAIGPSQDLLERAGALVKAGVDMLVLDTAHGHSKGVIDAVIALRSHYPGMYLCAGNIVTADAAKALAVAGVDAVKVGIGPGASCITRMVAGVGVPQLSAVMEVAAAMRETGVKVIADGGIKYSGDVVKALAAGAHAVMIGSLFAGTDEAPGEPVVIADRAYKMYRGMGSIDAMAKGSKDRYGQASVKEARKLVPEGVEGRISCRGPLADVMFQLVGGLRSGMGYLGAKNAAALWEKARFVRVTSAGLRESHVHDISLAKDTPNYRHGS